MQTLRSLQASVLILALSLVGGCAGPRAGNRNERLLPSSTPYERDIPLPTGFVLADQSSEDWSNGSIRYLRHRYSGPADKDAVRQFYREQMPLVRWTPISDGNVGGRITMRFEREAESCTITIDDKGPRVLRRIAVEVIITPNAR